MFSIHPEDTCINNVHVVSFPGFWEEPGNEAMYANITHKFVNFRNASRVAQEWCGSIHVQSEHYSTTTSHKMVHTNPHVQR